MSQSQTDLALMRGKRGIIFGVANNHSLAWGIAEQLHRHGAEIAFTYPSDAMKKRVEPLAKSIGSDFIFPCDVTQNGDIEGTFEALKAHWTTIDFVVHSISFSDKNELRGDFLDLSRDNFLNTMLVSCYSFIDVAKQAKSMMNPGGSILTLSYYGAEKVIPHYNVMALAKSALETSVQYAAEDLGKRNIRVNTLSCGPIKTLAASGIGDFHYILQWSQSNAPLRRGITLEDVGKSALYMLSDLSSGVTGETLHVDAGYHVVGMKAKDAKDIVLNVKE
jgi:enoyl-[acyl-carrier protein] reductase I